MNVLRTRALVLVAVLLAVFAVACGSSDDDGDETSGGDESTSTTEDTPATTLPTIEKLRNERYCDVIATVQDEDEPAVYSTFGLNKCPQAKWDELDEDTAADELDAESVILDGPRHWVFDEIDGEVTRPEDTVRLVDLVVALRPNFTGDAVVASADAFEPVDIEREVALIYREGANVYTLTSPTGEAYVMVSFSQQEDASLKMDQLVDLADILELPDGWTFAAARADEAYTMEAGEATTAIRDDLGNTYQQITTPPVTGSGSTDSTATTVANTATTVATTAAP